MIDWKRYIPAEAVVFTEELAKTLRFKGVTEGTVVAHKGPMRTEVPMPCLIFDVTHEDEKPVIKKWYCASKKAIMTMKPYIDDGSYTRRKFTITKHGIAPAAWYEITVE